MEKNPNITLPRSFMYVPANKDELFPKAYAGNADALILDLEDAVSVGEKEKARASLREWLNSLRPNAPRSQAPDFAPADITPVGTFSPHRPEQRPQLWVRINAESIDADLDAAVCPAISGIFLAKASKESISHAGRSLDYWEMQRGLQPGSLGIIGLIESAASLRDAAEIGNHGRLATFGVGEVDLLADLRMSREERTGSAVDSIRVQVVIAAAAAGLLPPVAPTSTMIRDLEGFDETSRHLHALGFRSRTAVHPSQIEVIHRVFTPSPEEARAAKDLLDRFDRMAGGVATDESGRMIDLAVVRAARETLERASPQH